MNTMKTFYIFTFAFCIGSSCNNSGLENRNKVEDHLKSEVSNNDSVVNRNCFEDMLFVKLDSLGYSSFKDDVGTLNDSIKKEIDFLVARKRQADLLPLIDLIEENELYIVYPKKKGYPVKNSSNFFPNTMTVYKWRFKNKETIESIRLKYDDLLNIELQPASFSYYDYGCNSIWFFTDVQGKVSYDFLKIKALF